MNEELQSLIDRAMAAGRSREQIVAALKDNGLDSNGLLSVDSYIKKKSPSDLEGSSLQSGLRPSVSESLSSERVQIGFDESAIQQKKKAIADAAAAQVYTAVAKTGGDLNKIQDKQAFADAYTTYRSMSDDPRASLLPQNPVAQDGQIDFAVVPTLKRGAIEYVNDLIEQEKKRKAELGERAVSSTIPFFDIAISGAENAIGGLASLTKMLTGQDNDLSGLLDDSQIRFRDALVNLNLSEEQIDKGIIENISDGDIVPAFKILGATLLQQVPQYAIQALAGPAGLAVLGASAAGGGYSMYEDRSDLSEAERMALGIGIGTAEYIAERMFLGDVNMLRKALGKEGMQSLTKKELGDMMFGSLPKGVRSVLEEGTEEVLTSVAQQTLGKIIAGEDFDPIEIAESAIYGGTAGGGIYLLSRGTGAIVDPENEAKMRGLKNILKRTKKAEQQPDITDAEKEALRRKAQETQEALNALKIKDDELVARMSEEDRTILKDIQTQIKSNIRDIRVAKTEEGKDQLEAELRRNLDKLNQLRDKYAGQEEVGIPSPIVEGEAPVETQPVEGAGQEAPEAGGVLQVPIEEGPEEVAPIAVEETPVAEEVKAPLPEGLDRFANIQSYDDVVAILESEPVSVDPNDELNSIFDLVDDYDNMESGPEKKLLETQIALRFSNLLRDKNRSIKYPSSKKNRLESISSDNSLIKQVLYSEVYNSNGTIKSITSRQLINKVKEIKTDIESYLEANAGLNTSTQFLGREDVRPTYFNRVKQQTAQPEAKPEAPVQKPFAEQTDDERIQRLMLDSFKNKAFPAIPSIQLKDGRNTNIPLGTTEQDLASALERGEVPTNDGVIKISDIQSVTGDGRFFKRKEVTPVEEPVTEVVTPAREPSPMEARAETAVGTDASGNAFIKKDDFITEFPALHSFFSSGEIFRRERGATETRVEYLRDNAKYVDWLKQAVRIRVESAKDFLVMMSSYKPRTQKDVERFNQAYIESERFLAQMMAAQKNDAIFKTKDQVIAVIKRQASLTPAQKEIMTKVIRSLNSEQLFNINFKGQKDFYQFATNLFKANNGYTIIHEIGHWGYFNILSAQERLDFMNYMANKFMDGETDGLVYPMFGNAVNAKDSYQEYFANQFDQWYTNQVGAEGVLKKMFEKLGSLVDKLINAFKEVGYNKDLAPFFERIADTTKYGMDKAKIDKIDSQLNEDLNVGDNYVGNPSKLSESVSDPEAESKLDIRQETMKDKAKKAWRSMWWSDDQRQIRTFKESLSSMLSREGMKIKEFAVGLNRILKNADQETIDLVSKVMDGSIKPEQKVQLTQKKDGDLIFALSNAMREYIDSLSEAIIFDPAFSKLSDDLQDTIIKNLGTYLRGTYRFWKDKRFFPGEKTIKAAIEEVYNTMYNEKFDELEKLFDVDGLASDIAKLEDQYEQLRDNIIEEERKLPAGEKTAEIKAMIANLEEIGNELKASRKLIDEQKKVMKELLKTDEMTPENIRAFKALKNSYIGSQLEFLAPAIKDDAKDFVKAYLEEAKKIRERDDFKGLGMVSPSSIKIPNKQFSQRKNLPETIKALLGEEKDPIIKFIDTALSLSNIKYKGDMIYKIASQFKGTDFVKNNATRAEVASGEYRVVTDKFSPLNGKYVHKDVFEAITDPQLYSAETAWFQTYLNILLLARKSKVIYNVPTWRKNLTGGWYTMMANGVINPSFFSDMRRRTQLLLDKRTDPETEALLDLMAEYGLLGQGVDANLIGAVNVMYTRPSTGNDMEYLNAFQKLGERVKGFDAELGNKYASVDDYTKLVVFRSEIKSFALKLFGKEYDELTPLQKDEVHAKAAERVKQSTPTFSRLPPFYYKLARVPLGDFLSFEFESIRSFVANFANGYIDIQESINNKELNQTQKSAYMKAGVARLMGVASVFGARFAVPTILAGLALGDDDELEDDVKALRPNWMEGHSIVPTNITKDGMATVYDYSMEDPYGTIFDVATDPLSFPSHVVNMLNPNMAITFLFNLHDSKDIYGKDIVNSYDSPFTKAYKYSGYTLKSLIAPPFISSAVRDEMSRAEKEKDNFSLSNVIELIALRAPIRDYKYDVASQLYYFGQEFATKKEQYSDLTGIARGNRLAELEEVRKMYKGLINIAIKKGNPKLILDANKNIKRQFKPAEEAYILYGYEIPEQQ